MNIEIGFNCFCGFSLMRLKNQLGRIEIHNKTKKIFNLYIVGWNAYLYEMIVGRNIKI